MPLHSFEHAVYIRNPFLAQKTCRKCLIPHFILIKGCDSLLHFRGSMFWVCNQYACSLRAGGRLSVSLILHSNQHSIIHLLIAYVSEHAFRNCQRRSIWQTKESWPYLRYRNLFAGLQRGMNTKRKATHCLGWRNAKEQDAVCIF